MTAGCRTYPGMELPSIPLHCFGAAPWSLLAFQHSPRTWSVCESMRAFRARSCCHFVPSCVVLCCVTLMPELPPSPDGSAVSGSSDTAVFRQDSLSHQRQPPPMRGSIANKCAMQRASARWSRPDRQGCLAANQSSQGQGLAGGATAARQPVRLRLEAADDNTATAPRAA